MNTLKQDQIEAIISWLNSWDQLRNTAIPLRFKEDWTTKSNLAIVNHSKNITYEFIAYDGSVFKNKKGERVDFETIKDNFYKLNGRKGKIYHSGYTRVVDHGYIGGYNSFGFVFQDDLKMEDLDNGEKVLLEYCA